MSSTASKGPRKVKCKKSAKHQQFLESAIKGKAEAVEKYLKKDKSLFEAADELTGDSALHIASELGHDEYVSALIGFGVNVNVQASNQQTPLHKAAHSPSTLDSLRLLLDAKADPNVQDVTGKSPFI